MTPPASERVARRLIQKYAPTRMNSGNSPPMTLQKLVELAVPLVVTLCAVSSAVIVSSFNAVGIRDSYLVLSVSSPVTLPDWSMTAVLT